MTNIFIPASDMTVDSYLRPFQFRHFTGSWNSLKLELSDSLSLPSNYPLPLMKSIFALSLFLSSSSALLYDNAQQLPGVDYDYVIVGGSSYSRQQHPTTNISR